MRLREQVIIVTGGAGGIGLAYATRLLAEGARVVIADLAPGRSASLTDDNPDACFQQTDVTDPQQAQRMVDVALARFGRVDCLVNNAALFTTLERRPFTELTPADWERVLAVNVVGAFNCCKAVAPLMTRQGGGAIINIVSNVVHKGLPLLLHYVASKGALIAMTRSLARELGPSGVRVNALAPGYVLHEATQATDAGRDEQVRKLRALARTQTPEDLCGAVVYLASADSAFVTGQTLVVDGGEVFV